MSELTFIQKIAYGFLKEWINDNYVPRPVIQEYTKYMSRDHDFMDKTQAYFDNSWGQRTPCILLHREECKPKSTQPEGWIGTRKPKQAPPPPPAGPEPIRGAWWKI